MNPVNSVMLFIVILIAFTMPSSSMQETQSLEELTQASNNFAIHLFQTVGDNIVLSPLSVHMLLTLAGHGARGDTAKEMSSLLHHDLTDIKLLESQKALLDNLIQAEREEQRITKRFSSLLGDQLTQMIVKLYKFFFKNHPSTTSTIKNTTLTMVNRMFIDTSFKVKPAFQTAADTYFLSGLEVIDCVKSPEAARQRINSWVEGKTNSLVKNLLGSDVITTETRTVLVSAIHFKGMWAKKFDPADTRVDKFYIGGMQYALVPMMSLTGKKFKYAYSEALDAKLLEMPYEGHQYSMVIILPNKDFELQLVKDKLSIISLTDEISKMTEVEVDVKIPKFKIESQWKLKDNLKQMGMEKAFSDKADFSGIADGSLFIDDIIQKAYIEVNEEGTEAAAASGAEFKMRRLRTNPEFTADHPFLFLILTSKMKNVLFLGSVKD